MSVSRLDQLRVSLTPIHRTILAYLAESGRITFDSEDVRDLYKELGYIEKDIKEVSNNSDAIEFERFRLRPFLQRIHQTLLQEHVILAKPMLGWPEIACDPNVVFFVGMESSKNLVYEACKQRHLKLLDIAGGFGNASDRWDRLRSARITVFDLSTEAVNLRASIYHTFGASIALGQYPVVLALNGKRLPFDIDVQQVEIGGKPSDVESVGVALDKAFFSHIRRSGRSSYDTTIEQLKKVLKEPTPEESVVLGQLMNLSQSRTEAIGLMEYLISGRKHEGWALLYPRWPGSYPEFGRQTCFHITPFLEEMKSAGDAVERGCSDAGMEYYRGDQGPLSDIMQSIWKLTCQAVGVVADLTGLNDNVCLEVGIASALGRPILLTARKREDGTLQLYPDIEKFQVHVYKTPGELQEYVTSFLTNVF